jgi:hypothetical protein
MVATIIPERNFLEDSQRPPGVAQPSDQNRAHAHLPARCPIHARIRLGIMAEEHLAELAKDPKGWELEDFVAAHFGC